MKEPVIVQHNVRDRIQLDDKYDFTVKLTIGLAEHGDFYLTIDFLDLKMNDMQTLNQLTKLQRLISIKCETIKNENYKISHVVVTNFSATSNLSMTWECLSDDPDLYNDIIDPK